MQFSIVNGSRQKASPNLIGTCPACGAPTRSKCGELVSWHWAHISNKHCDDWWESESDWHRNWKACFDESYQEVVHFDELTSERHVADIKTKNGVVIEFQHSSISIKELRAREHFYKEMIWVVDGRSFKDRFKVYPHRLPAPNTELCRDFAFNQDGSDFRVISSEWFGDNYSAKYMKQKFEWLMREAYQGHHFFEWQRPKQIWFKATKPVYLDFGAEQLLELQKYPNHYQGCIRIIPKSTFINLHN